MCVVEEGRKARKQKLESPMDCGGEEEEVLAVTVF